LVDGPKGGGAWPKWPNGKYASVCVSLGCLVPLRLCFCACCTLAPSDGCSRCLQSRYCDATRRSGVVRSTRDLLYTVIITRSRIQRWVAVHQRRAGMVAIPPSRTFSPLDRSGLSETRGRSLSATMCSLLSGWNISTGAR